MILWYSGCGNSRFVADTLAHELGDANMVFIPGAARNNTPLVLGPDETLGIVFPVYSWSVPKLVSEFLRTAAIKGKPGYIFAAVTCGDETGLTEKHLRKDLAKQNLQLDAFFSFQMPETYVNLPGFCQAGSSGVYLALLILRSIQLETGQVDICFRHLEREECIKLQVLLGKVFP